LINEQLWPPAEESRLEGGADIVLVYQPPHVGIGHGVRNNCVFGLAQGVEK
jgi:hypothetical protein